MRRVASLIGTASRLRCPATAVLMPTTSPDEIASAPPELPGLRAASVWMTSSMMRTVPAARVGNERPSALHDAGGHAAGQSERVADRDDELTDAQVGRVAELGRGRRWSVGADDGEIRERIGTDDAERRGRPVGERGGA